MRIRSIKPEFWSSFTLARLSEPALILAAGLLNHCCDAGYFEADPRIIKSAIFPLREPSRSIPGCLSELSGIGYVSVRKAPDGRLVGHVVNFLRHQKINKPSKRHSKARTDYDKGTPAHEFTTVHDTSPSLFPEDSGRPPVALQEPSGKSGAGTGNREQGTGSEGAGAEGGARPESSALTREANRPLPDSINTPEFREAWDRWLVYWSQAFNGGRPMHDATAFAQLRELAEIGSARAIAAIDNSISKGGLKKPAEPFAKTNGASAVTSEEQHGRGW